MLPTTDGHGTSEIRCQTGVAKTAVWRWQKRFMQAGVDGLLRDKTGPPSIPPLGTGIIEQLVQLTLCDSLGKATHWTAPAPAMAEATGVSLVQRIWRSHGLQRHCSEALSSHRRYE